MTDRNTTSQGMDYDELLERAKELATPIDFESLIAAGVIEKQGAWYRIVKIDGLPKHASSKISSMKQGEHLLVKFRAPSKTLEKYLKAQE